MLGKYNVIYADPPWSYNDKNCNGAALGHYQTMKVKDICELPVKELADKDCVLFLWVTYPMLQEGLKVIESWGFKYKTIAFQWVKTYKSGKYVFGLGRWTRGNTDFGLPAQSHDQDQIVKMIDNQLLVLEAEYLISSKGSDWHLEGREILQSEHSSLFRSAMYGTDPEVVSDSFRRMVKELQQKIKEGNHND